MTKLARYALASALVGLGILELVLAGRLLVAVGSTFVSSLAVVLIAGGAAIMAGIVAVDVVRR